MIVDLFAGPGGWDVGLKSVTDEFCVGIELDNWACKTRAAAGLPTIRGDVGRIRIPKHNIEGLIASPPCQTFSQAGHRAGLDQIDHVLQVLEGKVKPAFTDPRTALVLEPLNWVRRYAPNWIALEQVRTVLPIWKTYHQILAEMGYSCWTGVLNAADYGVPQTRKRAILLASRTCRASKPIATHSSNSDSTAPLISLPGLESTLLPWVTMAEGLGWGATNRPGWTIPSHSNGGGPDGFGGSGAREAAKKEREEGRWAWERPSTTVLGSFRPDKQAPPTYRHPGDGPRQDQAGTISITVEDALVLQSFARTYPLQGPKTKKFEQVGNAIPPVLAAACLKSLLDERTSTSSDVDDNPTNKNRSSND